MEVPQRSLRNGGVCHPFLKQSLEKEQRRKDLIKGQNAATLRNFTSPHTGWANMCSSHGTETGFPDIRDIPGTGAVKSQSQA